MYGDLSPGDFSRHGFPPHTPTTTITTASDDVAAAAEQTKKNTNYKIRNTKRISNGSRCDIAARAISKIIATAYSAAVMSSIF